MFPLSHSFEADSHVWTYLKRDGSVMTYPESTVILSGAFNKQCYRCATGILGLFFVEYSKKYMNKNLAGCLGARRATAHALPGKNYGSTCCT